MRVQFIIKPKTKRKVCLKHISYYFPVVYLEPCTIELVSNLTTTEFIKSFKRLILRRGKPNIVYSDNAKTFKAGVKWLANKQRS